MTGEGGDRGSDGTRDAEAQRGPGIEESLSQLKQSGRAALGAGGEALKAFRVLLAADVALARAAAGRSLALAGVAMAFGASCWLLLMAALVTWLARGLGLSFPLALLLCALLSGAVAGWASWLALRYFEHTRMQATRRQLARLGLGELSELMPGPGSSRSTREAARQVPGADGGPPPKQDIGADITPP